MRLGRWEVRIEPRWPPEDLRWWGLTGTYEFSDEDASWDAPWVPWTERPVWRGYQIGRLMILWRPGRREIVTRDFAAVVDAARQVVRDWESSCREFPVPIGGRRQHECHPFGPAIDWASLQKLSRAVDRLDSMSAKGPAIG